MPSSTARRGIVFVGTGALLLIAGSRFIPRANTGDALVTAVRQALAGQVDSLDASLEQLSRALAKAPTSPSSDHAAGPRIRFAFHAARARYKRLEGPIEFYAPALAAAFNSRRQEVDDDDAPPPSTLAPSGFPPLEELLGPSLETHADSARRIVEAMRRLVVGLRAMVPGLVPTESQVVEIARLEMARVSTLGIAGFDTPRTGAAMTESADALDGVRELLDAAGSVAWRRLARQRDAVDSTLERASDYLRVNPTFETFNRLAFVAFHAEPAARALDDLRRAAEVTPVRIRRAWRVAAPSVYSTDAFDTRPYAPSGAPPSSPELVMLGEQLFADPSLSGPGTRSCASCHNPSRAFADGLPRAASLAGRGQLVDRNTPTLINAALQPTQFADGRSPTLEDQVLEVLRSSAEMGSSVENATETVKRLSSYRSAFARAFGDTSTGVVTGLHLRQALAAFVRTLVSFDSRFDRAVHGDTAAITSEERRGFTLFMGKAACGTCHFAPLFSGNTPPLYIGSDVEVIGTPVTPGTPARLDPDAGRAGIDHLPVHLRAFKTPSLRNVAVTAPYMHNGAFRTLEDVLVFYDHGGGRGAGASLANQTLAPDSLHLTAPERRAIIAFLGALTDTAGARRMR